MLTEYVDALRRYLTTVDRDQPAYYPITFRPRSMGARQQLQESPRLPIEDVVTSGRNSAIVGPPGCGKSRALRQLAANLALSCLSNHSSNAPVPLYLPLRYCSSKLDFDELDWQEVFLAPMKRTLGEFGLIIRSSDYLRELIRGRKPVLLVDGLNELSQRSIRPFLRLVSNIASRHSVVLSSRVREYPTERADYDAYEVNPLNFPEDVVSFVARLEQCFSLRDGDRQRLLNACNESPVLQNLSSNPYLLTQMCRAISIRSIQFPRDRSALIELIGRQMISSTPLDVTRLENALSALAHSMHFEHHVLTLPAENALSLVSRDRAEAEELLLGLQQAKLLIRHSEVSPGRSTLADSALEFSHQVFQEYYAGRALFDSVQQSRSRHKRAIRACMSSTWAWAPISVSIACRARQDETGALGLAAWLARRSPHLGALALSEVPVPVHTPARELDKLLNSSIAGMQQLIRFWAFFLPHWYKWLPLIIVVTGVFGLHCVHHLHGMFTPPQLTSQNKPVLIMVSIGVLLTVPVLYFRSLHWIYAFLDERVFDRFVSRPLASLEQLQFRGGGNVLSNLRKRARGDPYMGYRMRSWICSTATATIGAPQEAGPNTLRVELADGSVLLLYGRPAHEQLLTVVDSLRKRSLTTAQRRKIVEWLIAELHILSRDDSLHSQITSVLCEHLEREAAGSLRRMIRKELKRYRAPSLTHVRWRLAAGLLGLAALVSLTVALASSSSPTGIDRALGLVGSIGSLLGLPAFVRWMTKKRTPKGT